LRVKNSLKDHGVYNTKPYSSLAKNFHRPTHDLYIKRIFIHYQFILTCNLRIAISLFNVFNFTDNLRIIISYDVFVFTIGSVPTDTFKSRVID